MAFNIDTLSIAAFNMELHANFGSKHGKRSKNKKRMQVKKGKTALVYFFF